MKRERIHPGGKTVRSVKRCKPEQIVTLLRHIEVEIANGETIPTLASDRRKRHLQLLAAIAPNRSQRVTCQALGMYAQEWRRTHNVTHDERNGAKRTRRLAAALRCWEKAQNRRPMRTPRAVYWIRGKEMRI